MISFQLARQLKDAGFPQSELARAQRKAGYDAPGARPFEKKIVGVTDPRPCDELIDKSAIFPGE